MAKNSVNSMLINQDKILITVCMPTFNRGDMIESLIFSLLPSLKRNFGNRFEILVSDNHSVDDTFERVINITKLESAVRIVQPPVHYPTAEENLHFSISKCVGEYVWILGDDDAVEPKSVNTLKRYLESGKHELLIFNSRSHSHSGQILKDVRIPCLAPYLEISLLNFIKITGFWFVISGFSTTVFRRKSVNLDNFKEIMEIGKIYSQVTWLISQFHNKNFIFINEPLVAYRQNLSDVQHTGHWEKVEKREKLFPRAIWTNGFLKQVDYLVEKDIFPRDFLREVVDRNIDRRFFFPDQIFLHFIDTIIDWLDRKGVPIPPKECEYFINWMKVLWPDNICLLTSVSNLIHSIFHDVEFDRTQLDIAAGIITQRMATPWYRRFHIYDVYGYSVHYHADRYFALANRKHFNIDLWLAYADFSDVEGHIYVRDSESELIRVLSQNPNSSSFVSEIEAASGSQVDVSALANAAEQGVEISRLNELLRIHTMREIDLERQIFELKKSSSWIITAPLRAVFGKLRSR